MRVGVWNNGKKPTESRQENWRKEEDETTQKRGDKNEDKGI